MGLSNGRIHVCPVETSLELLSGKWKPRILWKLHQQGVLRFGEFRRELPDITAKMLTQQLRDLERDGLVNRTVYPEVPPKVEYALSEFGETLKPILDMIAQWGTANHRHIIRLLEEPEPARSQKVG
ncbi:MAG: helix-turn-helix transcriptional regulator [Anaerolineae bacterium]|nr:helix-turn-helix transcriptional regulator [Anaerolineae bacterium]